MIDITGLYDGYRAGEQQQTTAAPVNTAISKDGTVRETDTDSYAATTLSAVEIVILNVSREKNQLRFYTAHMLEIAPSEEEERLIMEIRNELLDNIDLLERLYYDLSGKRPPYITAALFLRPENYCSGLRYAILFLQNMTVFVQEILFAMEKKEHVNILTKIITDMYRQIGTINYIYAKNGCRM